MTHKQYVLMCIGFFERKLRLERSERLLNYNIIKGWADPSTLPSMEKWWPIAGDKIISISIPTEQELLLIDKQFRNIGRKNV